MLSVLRLRDILMGTRTKLINCARRLVKPTGTRIPICGAATFSLDRNREIANANQIISGEV
jgi:transposase